MRKKMWLAGGGIVASIVTGVMLYGYLMPGEEYVPYRGGLPYQESDITKANEKFQIASASVSMKTTDISRIKHTVVATFRGEVIDIGKPIDWRDNVDNEIGSIPITITIIQNTKDSERKNYQAGEQFTFYVDSSKVEGIYFIPSYEADFEVGEEVIVHIGKSSFGPLGTNGDNYFVELGDFGKYKIIDNKAYNKKYPDGRSIMDALGESRWP